jgi:hypothetical protein
MSHVLKQVQVHEPFITTDGGSMTVSIALPKRIVADLERIGNPGQPSLKLSRPQLVATCVAYALYSCRGTEGPGADDDFVDLALRLMALQPSSRVSLDTD